MTVPVGSGSSRHGVLFEPIALGPRTARNRFYQPPFGTEFGNVRPGTQASYQATRAEGGWGVVHIDFCSIHPSSDVSGHVGARLWDDGDVRTLALTCEQVHAHDSLAAVELWYGGPHAANLETRMPARGASQVASTFGLLQSCLEASRSEIREVQRWYVEGAKRARSAGFDLINVYMSHGMPITYQFFDPAFNKRSDEYGGSFENRARFFLETLEQVADAVGEDCAIAVRLFLGDLESDGSVTMDDTIGIVSLADDFVDLWDLQRVHSTEDVKPSRFGPQGHQRPWLELVRPATDKPIVGFGRFTDPDLMAELVSSGLLQMIGGARPSIADPFLPRKIQEGRLDEIRECIGCNVCVSRFTQHSPLICTQNATAGEEYRRGWHPERFSKADNADLNVLVVGAGPAGMECATVLGKRGMGAVHLVDSAGAPGGALKWITRLPGLGEWRRVVDWRATQLTKLSNVNLITGVELNAGDVRDYGAELVVVATGSHWTGGGLNGFTQEPITGADSRLAHVLTPEQLMVDQKQIPGNRVLVYDCDGYFVAAGVAEKLAREGARVTFVTPFDTVAPFAHSTLEGPELYRMLHGLGVRFELAHVVDAVEPSVVSGHHMFTYEPARWETDAAVLVTQRVSDDGLYRELRADPDALAGSGIRGVYRIGDCAVPRLIADAIFDGHRLGREIDKPDPETPLPYLRERAGLDSGTFGPAIPAHRS